MRQHIAPVEIEFRRSAGAANVVAAVLVVIGAALAPKMPVPATALCLTGALLILDLTGFPPVAVPVRSRCKVIDLARAAGPHAGLRHVTDPRRPPNVAARTALVLSGEFSRRLMTLGRRDVHAAHERIVRFFERTERRAA